MKYGIQIAILTVLATSAVADLELTVDIEYPRHIELKMPVEEDSSFAMRTAFGDGEFFSVTGHVDHVTLVGTNRFVNLACGYEYKLGKSAGSATESGLKQIDGGYLVRVICSIWTANPMFTIHEVAPPQSPALSFTNMTIVSNLTYTTADSSTETNAQPAHSGVAKPTPDD